MPAEPPEGYVSSADACAALGISDRTLRRRVQAGTIAGEYVARPQGTILYVKLPDGLAAPQAAAGGDAVSDAENHNVTGGVTRGEDTATLRDLWERIDGKDAALLAATERAVKAEGERDAARQAAEAAQVLAAEIATRAAMLEAQRDELRRRLAEAEARLRRRWWKWWG